MSEKKCLQLSWVRLCAGGIISTLILSWGPLPGAVSRCIAAQDRTENCLAPKLQLNGSVMHGHFFPFGNVVFPPSLAEDDTYTTGVFPRSDTLFRDKHRPPGEVRVSGRQDSDREYQNFIFQVFDVMMQSGEKFIRYVSMATYISQLIHIGIDRDALLRIIMAEVLLPVQGSQDDLLTGQVLATSSHIIAELYQNAVDREVAGRVITEEIFLPVRKIRDSRLRENALTRIAQSFVILYRNAEDRQERLRDVVERFHAIASAEDDAPCGRLMADTLSQAAAEMYTAAPLPNESLSARLYRQGIPWQEALGVVSDSLITAARSIPDKQSRGKELAAIYRSFASCYLNNESRTTLLHMIQRDIIGCIDSSEYSIPEGVLSLTDSYLRVLRPFKFRDFIRNWKMLDGKHRFQLDPAFLLALDVEPEMVAERLLSIISESKNPMKVTVGVHSYAHFLEAVGYGLSRSQMDAVRYYVMKSVAGCVLNFFGTMVEVFSVLKNFPPNMKWATVPYLRLFSVALQLQSSRDYEIREVPPIEEWPKISSDIVESLLSSLNAEQIRMIYSDLRCFLKSLPGKNGNLIKEMKEAAVALSEACYGWDCRDGFIGELREDVHNRPGVNHLKIALAYNRYLESCGRDTALFDALKVRIPDGDEAGYDLLRRDPIHLQRVREALAVFIVRMENVFESSGALLLEAAAKSLPAGHQLQSEINAVIADSREMDNSGLDLLIERLRDVVELREQVVTEIENAQSEVGTFNLMNVDISLDVLVCRLSSGILSKISAGDARMRDVILFLLNAAEPVAPAADRNELELIEKEMRSLSYPDDSARYFSCIQRLERVIQRISEEVVESYQEQAQDYAEQAGIDENAAAVKEFAANLLRQESVYQLSLAVEMMSNYLVEKSGINWRVARCGVAEGHLRYVFPERIQAEIFQLTEPAIFITEYIPEDLILNENVRGLVSRQEQGMLSHVAIRVDQVGAVLASPMGTEYERLRNRAKADSGQWYRLEAGSCGASLLPQEKRSAGNRLSRRGLRRVTPLPPDLSQQDALIVPDRYRPETVGKKAVSLYELDRTVAPVAGLMGYVPNHVAVPFGYFEKLLGCNGACGDAVRRLRAQLNQDNSADTVKGILAELREQLQHLNVPDDLSLLVRERLGSGPYMVRSSTNAEDLAEYPGAGLYDSFAQVYPEDAVHYLKMVYASLYSEKAYFDRHRVRMDEREIYPAVVFQNMAAATYGFVIHSKDPTSGDGVLIELVQGLGESLVSGNEKYQGSAHRFRYYPETGNIERLGYANKSYRIDADGAGGTKDLPADYSADPLAVRWEQMTDSWREVLRYLGRTAKERIAASFGTPQDIEGVIELTEHGLRVGFVQSRNQVGFTPVTVSSVEVDGISINSSVGELICSAL